MAAGPRAALLSDALVLVLSAAFLRYLGTEAQVQRALFPDTFVVLNGEVLSRAALSARAGAAP